MRKLFFVIPVLVVLIIAGIFWHRSHSYVVGFFMLVERGQHTENAVVMRGLHEAWQIGIDDAHAKGMFKQEFIEIPDNKSASIAVLKQKVKEFLSKYNSWWWSDNKILIVAGIFSDHLRAAQEVVKEAGRHVLCASATSTTPQAASWPHVLQMVHNDGLASQAAALFMRRKQYDRAVIFYIPGDSYSQGYHDSLIHELSRQGILCRSFVIDSETISSHIEREVNPYFRGAKKPVFIFIGFVPELMKAAKVLDANTALLCTDTCSELGDLFAPMREVTVETPAIIDYTTTTRSVYQRVFGLQEKNNPFFDYTVSFGVPFMYDFAYQVGLRIVHNLDLTWQSFALKLEAAKPAAAINSSWYVPERNGPAHGGYWFMYTHDPKTKNLIEYKKLILGNTNTLTQSAAAAYQIGYFSWAGLLGWNIYQNIWENYAIGKNSLTTKLSYVNSPVREGMVNWAPFHVKKYRDERGKWWFASELADTYPLEEKSYVLT